MLLLSQNPHEKPPIQQVRKISAIPAQPESIEEAGPSMGINLKNQRKSVFNNVRRETLAAKDKLERSLAVGKAI